MIARANQVQCNHIMGMMDIGKGSWDKKIGGHLFIVTSDVSTYSVSILYCSTSASVIQWISSAGAA